MGAGKWIGGILGFMTMGPLGALAGFALGSLLDGNNGLFGNTYEKGHGTSSFIRHEVCAELHQGGGGRAGKAHVADDARAKPCAR